MIFVTNKIQRSLNFGLHVFTIRSVRLRAAWPKGWAYMSSQCFSISCSLDVPEILITGIQWPRGIHFTFFVSAVRGSECPDFELMR